MSDEAILAPGRSAPAEWFSVVPSSCPAVGPPLGVWSLTSFNLFAGGGGGAAGGGGEHRVLVCGSH